MMRFLKKKNPICQSCFVLTLLNISFLEIASFARESSVLELNSHLTFQKLLSNQPKDLYIWCLFIYCVTEFIYWRDY